MCGRQHRWLWQTQVGFLSLLLKVISFENASSFVQSLSQPVRSRFMLPRGRRDRAQLQATRKTRTKTRPEDLVSPTTRGVTARRNKGPISCWFARISLPPRGRVMLKKITSFDAFACLVMIVAIFYLAAITHILPLPESALTRLSRFSIASWMFCTLCGSWVLRLFD